MDFNEFFGKILKNLAGRHRMEWSQGSGDNDGYWQESDGVERSRHGAAKRRRLWLIPLGIFVVFFLLLPWLATFITELYWYESLGFEAVFWRRFTARCQLFIAVLLPTFIIYLLNWRVALRFGSGKVSAASDVTAVRVSKNSVLTAAIGLSLVSALGATGYWGIFLRFLNAVPFGETDPIFGRDIGFYVFSLPFLTFLRERIQSVLVVSLMGSAVIYFLTRSLCFVSDGLASKLEIPRRVRLHMTLLAALILVAWGMGYLIDRYLLLFSPTGVVFGAGYTDIAVILPALNILSLAAFAAAAMLLVNFFKPMWKLSIIIVGALLVLGMVSRTALPGLIQQYRVKPNEYEMEKEFIAHNLDYTRRGFGLNNVTTVSMTPNDEVTAAELLADQDTVSNVRLWDYSPLLRTYKQLQAIRTYYDFQDVFIDRYEIEGRNRQVMLSVRELDLSHLQNRTWVNSHLEFTHGYGVVMNPVNEVAPGGMPNFFMKDLPTRSIVDIKLDRPEIYYGTKSDSYVLVNTAVKEFDYPMGNSNIRSNYAGKGGVSIGSMWRRLLFTLRFRDSEILFTSSLNKDSCVLFHRNAQEAMEKLAPFLIYDQDIFPVLQGGRILWAQDSFSWSEYYPYSRPFSANDGTLNHFFGVNYVRNSVKATVDAYTGEIKFYIVDANDPVIQSWRKIFPQLFTDGGEMPEGLREHMRYPENLFEVQTEVYRTYHMTDTNTYYNREDVWEVTPAGRERRIQPNYVTMKLWGKDNPEFAIIVPFMPLGRDNLIGWMAGRCDPGNYGELLVYEFPKQKQIYGPAQIEALIDQNPEISAQLSLWGQHGSDVIRGDLLVVPAGKSLLYVQPLYIKAERGEMPELKRVIVSTGGRVAWADTFGDALERLVGQKIIGGATAAAASIPSQRAAATPSLFETAKKEVANKTGISALAKHAQELYDLAQRAQRDGDWALYGSKIKELGRVLAELEEGLR